MPKPPHCSPCCMAEGRRRGTDQGMLERPSPATSDLLVPHSTENTGMIAGLGKAAELVAEHVALYGDHMRHVRDYLEEQLKVSSWSGTQSIGRDWQNNIENMP